MLAIALTGCGGGGDGSVPVNVAPTSSAGAAQSVLAGTTVTLDGSASTDADSDPLTFAWSLTSKPAGSSATLTGATSARPTFNADLAGTYVASLIVNDGKASSAAAATTITVAVGNAAPVASAGVAQNVLTGTVVTLDGRASSDANADPLSFVWIFTSRPAGSAATLTGATTAQPSFNADVAGTYVATLVVHDGKVSSAPAVVTVTATAAASNAAPVANAGVAQTVATGTVVTLDGSASTDANADPLTFAWTLTSRPAGSTAALTGATKVNPSFIADRAGTYVATLVVHDGKVSSAPVAVTVSAMSGGTCDISNFQSEALALVNAYRAAGAQCGDRGSFPAASALAWNPALTRASLAHSEDMVAHNFFSHTGSNGSDIGQRATAAGYAWSFVGENIAAGYASINTVVGGWMASPGHCANIMNANFNDIGLACVAGTAGNTYSNYWTMDLGRPQ